MADVIPAGPLAVGIDALRTLLANCAQFQAWTSTADAAHALLRIFTGEMGFPIVSVAIAGGVCTVTTREPHNMVVGQVVTLEGKSIGAQSEVALAGSQTITGVGAASFNFNTALPDLAAVEPDVALVLPCARPLAVICESEGGALDSEVIGTGGAAVFAGGLEILLEGVTSTQYANDPANALAEARNWVGLLVQDLAYNEGTADLMVLNDVKISQGPRFVTLAEQDNSTIRFERWQALLAATWGVRG